MFTRKSLLVLSVVLMFSIALLVGSANPTQAADSKWQAKYWNNENLSGEPVLVRSENSLNKEWGDGSPHADVETDEFSARWTRTINFSSGAYRFTATMDDGMRVWVDDNLIIDSWWDSQEHSMSADIYLSSGDHRVKVEYYEAGGKAVAKLSYTAVGGSGADDRSGVVFNWRGEYFNNAYLGGSPVFTRDDAAIDFNWAYGSPGNGVSADAFSIRWTRNLALNGRYRFTATSDDGVRLWVNNQLVIDQWHNQAAQSYAADVTVNGTVPVKLEYYEAGALAEVHLTWTPIGTGTTPPAAGGPYTAFVNTGSLNVRQGPGIGYGVITALPQNTAVTLTHRDPYSSWVRILTPGNAPGWVNGNYLASNLKPFTFLPVWPGTDGQSGAPTAVVANASYLNMRRGPGVSYSVITILSRGQILTLPGYRNADASWVQVRTQSGVTGWVNASYLSSAFPFTNLAVGGW